MALLFRAFIILLPWGLRRRVLGWIYGYEIHPSSRIGLAWVYPENLVMEAHSYIGHLTVCKGLSKLHLGEQARIGRANWITGYPRGGSRHFVHQSERTPELILGPHAAITSRHLIDCTNRVSIGAYSTLAGFRSQILTHSIDLRRNRQDSAPVTVGEYCFVGTDSVLLAGSRLPPHSVLGAKSLLNKALNDEYTLYGGVPAREVGPLSLEVEYFTREVGFVH